MENKEKNISNEKKKNSRFPKFRFLDVVIILLIVAVIAGVFFRQNIPTIFGKAKDLTNVEVSFSVTNVNKNAIDAIDVGDVVYFDSDGSHFGTMTASSDDAKFALSKLPAYEVFFENGEYKTVYYPDETNRVNAKGKIDCKGAFSNDDGSFMLNGSTYLAAGQTVVICTEKVTLEIVITDIVEKAD